MVSVILAGLGLAAIGYAGKYAARHLPNVLRTLNENLKKIDINTQQYKGGFEQNMSKREASLILGVSAMSDRSKIKEAFKRVMTYNHPDKGGSPYIASKINEAKDLLEKNK